MTGDELRRLQREQAILQADHEPEPISRANDGQQTICQQTICQPTIGEPHVPQMARDFYGARELSEMFRCLEPGCVCNIEWGDDGEPIMTPLHDRKD